MINKWEEQIAAGEEPDLEEAFSEESLDIIRARLGKSKDGDMSRFTMKATSDHIERLVKKDGKHFVDPNVPDWLRTATDKKTHDFFKTFGTGEEE